MTDVRNEKTPDALGSADLDNLMQTKLTEHLFRDLVEHSRAVEFHRVELERRAQQYLRGKIGLSRAEDGNWDIRSGFQQPPAIIFSENEDTVLICQVSLHQYSKAAGDEGQNSSFEQLLVENRVEFSRVGDRLHIVVPVAEFDAGLLGVEQVGGVKVLPFGSESVAEGGEGRQDDGVTQVSGGVHEVVDLWMAPRNEFRNL